MKYQHARWLVCSVLLFSSMIFAQTAITTYHVDTYRSGANTSESVLNPTNVNATQFGRKAVFTVQGYVYAQPLYVPGLVINGVPHNVVYIATEHDQLYAFDVDSGQQLWRLNFLATTGPLLTTSAVPSNDIGCNDLVPEIGITGTPVIDLPGNTMYLVAKTKQFNAQTRTTKYFQTLHAVDIRSGAERSIPRSISATFPGTGNGSINGVLTFDPLMQGQRSALLLVNDQLVVTWGSHCDIGAYHGWIMSFSKGLISTGVFVDTPNGYEGGSWSGGSGPSTDGNGGIYLDTGNGHFNATAGGIDYGDSILRLNASGSGIAVSDYFTPWDQLTLDVNDADLGSGGVILLPDQPDAPYPHLLLQAGKEGTIYLVNRDNMGQFHVGDDSQIVQSLPFAIGGIWGSPAFWNNNAYFGGTHDHLKAFSFDPVAQQLSTGAVSQSPEVFSYPGPVPAVSSNGMDNGVVWLIQTDNWRSGGNAVLRAYDATNVGIELYNSEQNSSRDRAGAALKFTAPAIADGHVFVGGQNQVAMYGLLQ